MATKKHNYTKEDYQKHSIKKLAEMANTSYQAIHSYGVRHKFIETESRKKHDWDSVDWNLRTKDIAAQLGVIPQQVSIARRKYAKGTCREVTVRVNK